MARCCVLLLLLAKAQAQQKLLFGYQIQSDVAAYLDLAYHVRDMRRAATIADGMIVYTNDTATVSLQSLSTDAWEFWKSVPMYNVYVASFQFMGTTHEGDIQGNFDRQPANKYADTLVQDLFELGVENLEATAAVSLNVVMAYWGSLYQFILGCERGNTDQAHQTMTQALDKAVALWIGNGQVRNENQDGFMLYNMAEQAGARFGQDEGESIVNSQFLEIVLELKQDIEKGSCTMLGGYKSVHSKVKQLIKYTNVVLVQMLIHFMFDAVDNGGSSDFVEVLSLSLLPQVHGCDTNLFNLLVENTVNNDMDASRLDTTIKALQHSLSCFDITCSEVGSYENGLLDACTEPQFVTMAGYVTTTDVADLSHLDRDIRHMRMAMDLENWRAAGDLFAFGWNSDFSLRGIATGNYPWSQSDDSRLFETFYKEDPSDFGYSSALIDNALRGVEPFAVASTADRAGVVVGSIQSNVLYMAVTGQLSAALQACDERQADLASLHWDGAAAIMIGSAEGENTGGQDGGQSIFAISKQFCETFGTCEPNSSVVAATLTASLKGGGSAVKQLACEEVQYVVSKDIFPNLLIPLLQGILYYSVQSYLSVDGAQGYLLAYTQAILPYVKNDNDAAALQANANYFRNPSSKPDVPRVFSVVQNLATPLATDCAKIGQMLVDNNRYGLCPNDPLPPHDVVTETTAPATAPTFALTSSPVVSSPNTTPALVSNKNDQNSDLAWGRYTFSDALVAQQDSLFTLDIRDMYLQNNPNDAGRVYFSPSKHAVGGLTGYPEVRSLQDFSARASLFMGQDPAYNFYRLALFDDEAFDGNVTGTVNGWAYGNAVEQLAIGENNGNSAQLGSKTAVVMEIWMMIAHRLYESSRRCQKALSSPELIDSAVGLWIGQDQEMESFRKGWSIYSLAQEAAELYGLEEKEARINTLLMEQFNALRSLVSSCAEQTGVYEKLRKAVDEAVKGLSVPLLQHLLLSMSNNDYEYVELFALGFIPQTIGVDEGIYEILRDALFQGYNRDSTITSKLMESFGKALHAMRFTCDDLGDVSKASVSLKGIVGVLCDEITMTFGSNIVAGYQTTSDIEELSRIDLDVLQMDLFLRANAYDLAFDIYKHGRNSLAGTNDGLFLSLCTLASKEYNEPAGNLYEQFADFFMTDQYPDKVVTEAILQPEDSRFAGSSRRQRSEAVRRTIQAMVVYLQVVSRLRSAIQICRISNEAVKAQRSVDEAAALYVGSIEGPFSGGSATKSGQMLFALSKEMCIHFDTCEGHGDAEVNARLEFAFSSTKEALADGNCDAAETIIEEDVMSQLPIPIIQGSLYFASTNDGIGPLSNAPSLASGDGITEAILPQVAVVNETSAAIIFENLDFEYGEKTVRSGKRAVFDAYSSVLDGLNVDCARIGTLQSAKLSTCGTESESSQIYGPKASTSTNLGNDLYISTTYVQDRADIAIDVKQIAEALSMGKIQTARLIYLEGRNSPVFNAEGKEIDLRTLESFSTNAFQTMIRNPLYHTFVYALGDAKGRFLLSPAAEYADSIVKEMFEIDSKGRTSYSVDAIIGLNLWMEIVNQLFQMVERCSDGSLSDADGVNSIDEAAAYWIGDGQVAGDVDQGHLLYALAEKMGVHFRLTEAGQSRTNMNILRLFHEAKMEVSLDNVCRGPSFPPYRLSHLVEKIVSMMVSVNVQALIHYLRIGGERSRVRVYAHAFVPLIATCDPLSFKLLKKDLLDSDYKEIHVESIVARIRNSLHCFDLSCDDVGVHQTESAPACSQPSGSTVTIAEYKPMTDIRQVSQIDLDILELGVLLEMGATEAADDVYTFGRHASLGSSIDGSTLRLKALATSDSRSIVPAFDGFRRFFDNDSNYADTLVRQVLASDELSNRHKKAVVVSTASFHILYMAALEHLYDALSFCQPRTKTETNDSAARAWDTAAALLIGSMEGEEEPGSEQGQLLWSLSKMMCYEFNTCSRETPGSSLINDELATLLYSGRGAILDGSCESLEKITTKLVATTQGPFIQASLSYAVKLSKRNQEDPNMIGAEAYVIVRALLPAIADINGDVAELLAQNFPLSGAAMSSGLHVVSEAFFSVLQDLAVDCDLLGRSDEVDFCGLTAGDKKKDRLLLSIFIVLSTTTAAAIAFLIRLRVKRKTEDPIFIPSDGELNHTSDLIPKKLEQKEESTTEEDEIHDLCSKKLVTKEIQHGDDENDRYMRAMEASADHCSLKPID